MAHCYKYAIAQLRANPVRGESLNIAIVVFDRDNLQIHRARNLDKLRAISGALDLSVVDQALTNLAVIDQSVLLDRETGPEARLDVLQAMSPIGFSAFGEFIAENALSYDQNVARLLNQLVEPEPAPRPIMTQRKTRLVSSLKAAFRAERILAAKGEGIDSQRIVADEPLADGLNADFLLKNGAMHIVQTVDASNTDRIRKAIQEIGVSSLVFEHAKMHFGEAQTQARLVYSASSQLEVALTPALCAAEHQGVELVNWESQDQRVKFIVRMSSLAEPSGNQTRADFGPINASGKDSRLLN
ncbi:hypothetical protein ACLBKT_12875 [Erythrobacter sp. W302b]|uniref:hypothetical protein n=1 Tax=Erythrobacter sp. W302b TaxID=3389874 RepID=UPI00396B3F04